MSVEVKICATRSLEAAKTAAEAGADFIGLVFTPITKTHTVNRDVLRTIGKEMKGKIQIVGVFQNMPLPVVQQAIEDCNLDYAQLHGDETPDYLAQLPVKTIKAFRLQGDFDLNAARKQMQEFKGEYYLLDRAKQSEGPMLNLKKAAVLATEFPLAFAGGLNPENVADVIRAVNPKMVDVASGVEIDGQQDLRKIKAFIRNAKEVML